MEVVEPPALVAVESAEEDDLDPNLPADGAGAGSPGSVGKDAGVGFPMEGNAEERRHRRLARRSLSSQFVQMAGKSGVIAEEGGWLERLVSNAAEYETNALNASIAGRNTARLNRAHGANAIRQGNQMAGASLLAGAGKLSGMAYSLYGGGKQAPANTAGTVDQSVMGSIGRVGKPFYEW